MKFSFSNKDQENSFLKSRVETLDLPDLLKSKLIEKRVVRGVISLSDKELNKIVGSKKNSALVSLALEKLAFEINYRKDVEDINSGQYETKKTTNDNQPNFPELYRNISPDKNEKFLQSEPLVDSEEDIIGTFAKHFNVDRVKLISGARQHDLVYIRDLIVCVLREYADMSFSAIGKLLGNRDHTTIIHSYRKLQDRFKSDTKLRTGLDELIKKTAEIKDRKERIKEKFIPELMASIRKTENISQFVQPIKISERNLKILELYREGLTLKEIGDSCEVTHQRVRQIVINTIKTITVNEFILKGIELDSNVILEEEKKKRLIIKNKEKILKIKPIKEKTWSRYYFACKRCGTTVIPHREHGLCQLCTGKLGKKIRDKIVAEHLEICDNCNISRLEALNKYGRDFYLTRDKHVFCRECFLNKTGKKLGSYKNYIWSRFYPKCKRCGTIDIPHFKKGLCKKCGGELTSKDRDLIIHSHDEKCDICEIKRNEARDKLGRDLYVTRSKEVLCKECFQKININNMIQKK